MFKNKPIPEVLRLSKVALVNASTMPEIMTALAHYRYDSEKFTEGMSIYILAENAVILQSTRLSEQLAKTHTLNQARAQAEAVYARHIKLARFVFQGHVEAWKTLGLDGRRAKPFGEWLAQARRFYTNLLGNPALLATLLPYNLAETDLNHALTLLATAETAYAARENARGIAIQATCDRDLALTHLKTWVNDLIAIARFALEDDPQLLESLGVVVK